MDLREKRSGSWPRAVTVPEGSVGVIDGQGGFGRGCLRGVKDARSGFAPRMTQSGGSRVDRVDGIVGRVAEGKRQVHRPTPVDGDVRLLRRNVGGWSLLTEAERLTGGQQGRLVTIYEDATERRQMHRGRRLAVLGLLGNGLGKTACESFCGPGWRWSSWDSSDSQCCWSLSGEVDEKWD